MTHAIKKNRTPSRNKSLPTRFFERGRERERKRKRQRREREREKEVIIFIYIYIQRV
jgi:hypothetical protein